MLDKVRKSNAAFHADVVSGLSQPQKSIPPKYFYDEAGSELFDAICDLPEYYPTRTEAALLDRVAPLLAERLAGHDHLVEYGSGASRKTRIVIDALKGLKTYIPLDVSEEFLLSVAERLADDYPNLNVVPVVADFTGEMRLPREINGNAKIGFFPGSTIGNLSPEGAISFLSAVRSSLGDGSAFILGADLVKSPATLLAAYNDKAGVTAKFNLNLLSRINRELGADFDLSGFAHDAVWNADANRIEMHLISKSAQTVSLNGSRFDFRAGETIHTENSYKFTPDGLRDLARRTGWRADEVWVDDKFPFAVALLFAA